MQKYYIYPVVDVEIRDALASIIRASLAALIQDQSSQSRIKSGPTYPYYLIGSYINGLKDSHFHHSLQEEFLLRLHLIHAVTIIANTRYSSGDDFEARNQEGDGKEIQNWYMIAYRRLIIIAAKFFDSVEEIDNVGFLPGLGTVMTDLLPACPGMFLGKSDNLQTLLFCNELSEWTLCEQRAILGRRYWQQRFDLVYPMIPSLMAKDLGYM